MNINHINQYYNGEYWIQYLRDTLDVSLIFPNKCFSVRSKTFLIINMKDHISLEVKIFTRYQLIIMYAGSKDNDDDIISNSSTIWKKSMPDLYEEMIYMIEDRLKRKHDDF